MRPFERIAGLTLPLACGLVLVAPAGESSHEALVKDMLGTVEQIGKILSEVKDRTSAEAARPELKKAAEKMLALRKQADEGRQPDKREKDRLAKEYGPKFEAAVKKLRDESIRVKAIPGGEEAVAELAILKDQKEKDKGNKDGK